jgi:hypothetical protein
MLRSERKPENTVWLRLPGYHVVALKPELDDHAAELERTIHQGIPAYPDLARADFYDVALEKGWAYIHVHRDRHAVYVVAHFRSTFSSFSADRSGEWKNERFESGLHNLNCGEVLCGRGTLDNPC